MSDIRDRLAEALRNHTPVEDGEGFFCSCTDIKLLLELGTATSHTPEHLADVLLSLEGVAIVALPEPDPDVGNYFNAGCGAITHPSGGDVRLHSVAWEPGIRGGVYRSPTKARELAAALLAAADAAEAVTDA